MAQTIQTTLMDHVRYLSEEIGPRPCGSAAANRAANIVRAAFEQVGLAVNEIGVDVLDWHHQHTALTLNGESLPVAANVYSPSCDVTAPLVAVCTPAEFDAADITGKIVLFYGELSVAPLIPLNCKVYNADRDQHINRQLMARHPAAVIGVNLNLPAVDSRIEDADQLIPSATVPADVGLKLLSQIGQKVHLVIDAERVPAVARTIIGRKDEPADKRITIMAHYDTKIDCPGAWDNASGVAVMLALLDRLSGRDLPVGLEFIAWGDHEYYAYGDIEYVEKYGDQMKDILVAINMDAVGQTLGANNIASFAASEAFHAAVSEVVESFPGVMWTDPWPQSNHSTFASRGVTALAFSAQASTSIYHQPTDTAAWISEAKLNEVVTLIEAIIDRITVQPVNWARP